MKSFGIGIKVVNAQAFFGAAVGMIFQIWMMVIVLYGGHLVFEGEMTVGKLVTFLFYTV